MPEGEHRFRALIEWGRLALVLHEVYRSYDLALRLLLAYDRRLGTGWSPAYMTALEAEPELPVFTANLELD